MTIFKDWFYFLIIARSASLLASSDFSFILDKASISVGESAYLTIEVPRKSSSFRLIINDDSFQEHPHLKLLERNVKESSDSWVVSYEITAYEPQELKIPALQIQSGPDSYSTESHVLRVTTSRLDNDLEIRPEFGSLALPFPWKHLYLIAVGLVSLISISWFFLWLIKKVSWKRFFQIRWSLPKLAIENHRKWLRSKLREIELKLEKGDQSPQLVDDIIFILKTFLHRKTHRPVLAWTRKDIHRQLTSRWVPPQTEAILAKAESFKYAETVKTQSHLLARDLIQEIRGAFRL